MNIPNNAQAASPKTSKAIIYTRVSTGEQAESGTSLEAQEIACFRKAKELGAQVVDTFSDPGVSGALYLGRPGIQAALQALESRQADTLIIYRLDRSGRDVDVIRAIRKRVEMAGGQLVFADGMNFENNAIGKLMFTQLAGYAEFEREIIRERTMLGRRRRAEQGQQPSRSRSPFGYHVVSRADVLRGDYPADQLGTYQIVEAEAEWVRGIFRRYAAGQSLTDVCLWLETNGVPAPKGGKFWRPASMRCMFTNPVYKGEAKSFRWRVIHAEERTVRGFKTTEYRQMTEEEEQITHYVTPLVDETTWERCQVRLQEGRSIFGGNPKRRLLLSTFLRCPHCGRPMRGRREKRVHQVTAYYECPRSLPSSGEPKRTCSPKLYPAEPIDRDILAGIEEAAQYPQAFDKALAAYHRKSRAAAANSNNIERLRAQLDDIEGRERAAVQSQIAGVAAGVSPDAYTAALAEIARERAAIETKLRAATVSTSAGKRSSPKSPTETFKTVLAEVREALQAPELTDAERHDILATVVREIHMNEDSYSVVLSPFDPMETIHTVLMLTNSRIPKTPNSRP